MNVVKNRLLQFIGLQGISNREFAKKIDVSPNILSTTSALGSDILIKISNTYPQLNIEWVVTGRGQMLKEAAKISELDAAIQSGLIDAAATADIMEMPISIDDKINLLRNRVTLRNIEIMALKKLLDDYVAADQKPKTVKEGPAS